MIGEYEKSIKKIIENVNNSECLPKNIGYFTNLIESRYLQYEKKSNDIALFSILIPEEIIRAMGLNPVWCLSGSYELGAMYSESFPRDADPVVKSSYGMYMQHDIPAVVAFNNDSFRKMSWLLKEGKEDIYELDIPAIKDMEKSSDLYNNSVKTLIEKLKVKYKTTLKAHNLYNAHMQIQSARKAISEMISLQNKKNYFSSYVLHFIISSYYCAENLNEYTYNLLQVISELKSSKLESSKLQIGILGSPLFFPNDKILNMTESLGININFTYNEINMFLKKYNLSDDSDLTSMINSVSNHYFEENIMPHNISKSLLIKDDLNRLDGIVYHVLKGQVLYDYNYLKLESEVDIPSIRVETDYNKEDVEQLRIRVEAFVEMISVLKSN